MAAHETAGTFLVPFAGPRLKLRRANGLLRQLRDEVTTFGAGVTFTVQEGEIDDPHMRAVRIVFDQKPPEDIPLLIGDVVHNLRSALDILMCDIARLRGRSTNGVNFPFAESSDALEARLGDRALTKLGPDVVEILRSLKPHKDGHAALRGLHDLDIADKHKLVLPVYLVAFATIPALAIAESVLPGISQATASVHEGTPWFVARQHDPMSMFKFPEGGPVPVFAVELPFAGQPVLETLEGLAQLAGEIVDVFATKLMSGNADPASTPVGDD